MRNTSRASGRCAALGALDFQVACFSHGKPITEGAAEAFGKTWGRE